MGRIEGIERENDDDDDDDDDDGKDKGVFDTWNTADGASETDADTGGGDPTQDAIAVCSTVDGVSTHSIASLGAPKHSCLRVVCPCNSCINSISLLVLCRRIRTPSPGTRVCPKPPTRRRERPHSLPCLSPSPCQAGEESGTGRSCCPCCRTCRTTTRVGPEHPARPVGERGGEPSCEAQGCSSDAERYSSEAVSKCR